MGQPFALWLLPAAAEAAVLSAEMAALAKTCGGLAFPPHLTLLGGRTADLAGLRESWFTHLAEVSVTALRVTGIGSSSSFFQSLFVAFAQDPEVQALSERLKALLDPASPYRLRPHLSLVYAHLDEEARLALERSTVVPLERVCFDRVQLAYPEGPDPDWNRVSSWRTEPARALRP